MQRRKTRTRRPELGAALVAAFCLAGCGSGSEHRVAPDPTLPAAVASGDDCRALSLAQQLQQETIAAINAGRVPGGFQEQLGSTVGDLVSRIQCVPAAKPHDNGKHKGKQKKKQEGDD